MATGDMFLEFVVDHGTSPARRSALCREAERMIVEIDPHGRRAAWRGRSDLSADPTVMLERLNQVLLPAFSAGLDDLMLAEEQEQKKISYCFTDISRTCYQAFALVWRDRDDPDGPTRPVMIETQHDAAQLLVVVRTGEMAFKPLGPDLEQPIA